jgi:succinate dehydrogenase/fumarate reductase flavoprotein subunit
MSLENLIEADVLVIGGGLAGCFASVKAKEQGADVVLVDKGYVSKTGGTPYAGDTMVFNPEWGHDLDAWMEQVSVLGEYVNNRQWNEIVFKESYDRFKDLESYGVKFLEENDEVVRLPHPLSTLDMPDKDKFPPIVSQVVHWLPGWGEAIRKHVEKSGVKLMERVVICELIKKEEKIVGAVGFPVDKEELIVFKTKSVVICAGGGGFRPPGYPTHELTADGVALAYRVGAEVTGKEFVSPMTVGSLEPHPGWESMYEHFSSGHSAALPGAAKNVPFLGRRINAEGEEVPHRGMSWHGWIDVHHEIHAGRGPLTMDGPGGRKISINGPGAGGSMHGHATAGIFSADTDGNVGVPGLYAAGDSLGVQFVGSTYSGFGFATSYASVSGARAGCAAAEFARKCGDGSLDRDRVEDLKKSIKGPLERKGGFSPRWVTEILRSYMVPYFVMYIKHEDRLKAALTNVGFIRDHLVPKITASDAHELRLAHETRSMVLNAEMKLRASMFRKESRGNHYREDYPKRDDPEWLAWVLLKNENGSMNVYKKSMPEEWWPDLNKPYDERYPLKFPESA